MRVKSAIMATALTAGLFLIGPSISAQAAENTASSAVALDKQVNQNSTFTLIRGGHGGGGHGGYGGHAMSHSMGGRSIGGGIGRHHFAGRRFFFRHHRHHRFFFAGPFFYDYGDGSCYWNCRQYHGPRYCRAYAANYCY